MAAWHALLARSYIDGLKQPIRGRGAASFANDARDAARTNTAFSTRQAPPLTMLYHTACAGHIFCAARSTYCLRANIVALSVQRAPLRPLVSAYHAN